MRDLFPLAFLWSRVAPFQQKPRLVPSLFAAGESRQVFQFFSQEHFKRSSDCTLSQFDHVIAYVRRTAGGRAIIYPSYEIVKANPQAEVRILFSSFDSHARTFAPVSSACL